MSSEDLDLSLSEPTHTTEAAKAKAKADKAKRTNGLVKRRLNNGTTVRLKRPATPGFKLKASKDAEAEKAEEPIKKPHRFKPGTVAAREVRKAQKKEGFFVPKSPFERLVREIVQEGARNTESGLRITANALVALQTSFEAEFIELLKAMEVICQSTGRKTIMKQDLDLLKRLYTNFDLKPVLKGNPRPLATYTELCLILEKKLNTTVKEAREKFLSARSRDKTLTEEEAVAKMIHFKCYDTDLADLVKQTPLEREASETEEQFRQRIYEWFIYRQPASSDE